MKFILEVRMKPGYTVEEYAAAWISASEIIQRTPGAPSRNSNTVVRLVGKHGAP